MLLDHIIPSTELSEFISMYRIADFVFDDKKAIPVKPYPPRPQECLHFYPRDPETVRYAENDTVISGKAATITGQHTVVTNRKVGKDFMVFQVVFQPGALYRITGIPAIKLANCYIDAEDILGKEVNLVNEQLFHAGNYREMVIIVEKYLHQIIGRRKRNFHVVDKIGRLMIHNKNYYSLDWFSREACLCYRQFDRMFKERMGINPKLFERIIKFDKAFRLKNKYPDKDWLTIAIHSDYYDYQHLAKAYKEFTGYLPIEFFKLELKSPERLFGDAEV